MIRLLLILALLAVPVSAAADDCLECHRKETPGAVTQWEASAHAGMVDCAGCHGEDHEQILAGESPVEAAVCGRCHDKAYHEHVSSRHGISLHAGWGCTRNLPDRNLRECRFCHEEGSTQPKSVVQCARFLAQSTEMRSLGCNRCHQVESSCASCHTNHITDLAAVRRPEVCSTCHMGPDHPQWEMWQTSRHGVVNETLGVETGPDCQACHMQDGSHDVSFGITLTSGMKPLADELRETRRAEMVTLCQQCHGKGFVERELANSDAIRAQSVALVNEAAEVIRELADEGLLEPSLQDRPAHPLRGQELVLDNQMLYEDYSHIERIFFKMKKFDLAKTVKGAYHQNPAYTHWYGNAELKMSLVDIKAEAARLRKATERQTLNASGEEQQQSVERQLQTLKNKHVRGVLSDAEYRAGKAELLKSLAPK